MRHLLGISTDSTGEVVHVHANAEGLKELRRRLDVLIGAVEAGRVEHDHLFTEAWAGEELTGTLFSDEVSRGHRVVNHLKIYAWTAESAEKLGFVPSSSDWQDRR